MSFFFCSIMSAKPKPKLMSSIHLANNAGNEALWRSSCSSRGMGRALQQKELIKNIQTAPHKPQNGEMHPIKDTLSQQPENLCAPSKPLHKKKEPKVCKSLYCSQLEVDSRYKDSLYSSYATFSHSSRKQHVSSKMAFGFYDNGDFTEPSFTQIDR